MKPYAEGKGWILYAGDCLDVLRQMEPGSVDAVVTDPPYIIGAISIGSASTKAGTWADMENSAYWFSAWYAEAARVLTSAGYLVTCCNWRSLPTLLRACSLAHISPSSCMVWDKEWIGPGGPRSLRPRWEALLFAAMKDGRIADRSAPDIYAEKWMAGNMGKTGHPAEKPVGLMAHAIGLVSEPGGLILDPFTGSGTTGVAALAEGRRFIGIEREPAYLEIAARRLREAEADGVQNGLFEGAT